MTRPAFVLVAVLLAGASGSVVAAQSLTTEADITVGRSTDDVNAAAAQIRVFGASRSDWRFFAEAAWGRVSGPPSDAFGAAYPYDNRLRPMEIFGEKMFHPQGNLLGLRAGRYRTPFGIGARSDHAYVGFVRAPLIRYGQEWALSNTFMEIGADVLFGRPSLSVEASLGTPQDEGVMRRRRGLDAVARVQGYYRSVIVGASVIRSRPSQSEDFAFGRMLFTGVDARWMRDGVQFRGEWITGRPFDGVITRGGYVDALVHHIGMGPVTAVARIERLDYVAGEFSEYLRRVTAGARIRLGASFNVQVNVLAQRGYATAPRNAALDAGLTYSIRR